MILNEEQKIEYLTKPDDAIPVTFEVDGDTVIVTFINTENSDYIVAIKDIKDTNGIDIEDSLVYKFTSTYSPLYVTEKQISSDLAAVIDTDSLDPIYNAIRANSLEVQYLTTKDIDWSNPPYEVKQYVKYQTELDIILGKYASITLDASTEKQLGDFSVSNGRSSATAFKLILDEIRRRADYWRKRLGESKTAPKSFVRGGNTYPDHLTRGF